MPDDELAMRPATATLALAAGVNLVSFAYRWEHPDDGPQDGLLVLGAGNEPTSLVATWGDSWHQQPAPLSMTGRVDAETLYVAAEYAPGWDWRVSIAATSTELRMRMENVVPDGGPYEVMVMDLVRALPGVDEHGRPGTAPG